MESINLNMEQGTVTSLKSVSNEGVITKEISEEFNLPDYIPEIRKLLAIKAQALPENNYLATENGKARLDIAGLATYTVIYTDDEGRLCSVPLSTGYEMSGELSTNPDGVITDTMIESVTSRVNDKRRLTIKSRVKSKVMGISKQEVKESVSPSSLSNEMYLERMGKKISALEIAKQGPYKVQVSDKFDMQGIKDARPVWCDASVVIKECRAREQDVNIRGDVSIKCICKTDEGNITFTKAIPFTEELPIDNTGTYSMASAEGRCISLSISNEMNDDANQLFFDLEYELEWVLMGNRESWLPVDCYSTMYETEVQYKSIDTYEGVRCQNVSFSLNEALKIKNGEIKEIIDTYATPTVEKTEIKGRKLCTMGKVDLTLIGRGKENEMGEYEYISDSYEIPFKYETEIGENQGDIISRSLPFISNINARYDADRLMVNCEIYLKQDVFRKSREQILESTKINTEAEIKNNPACVRVCFPTEGSTLWEIAKKYHVSPTYIAKKNALSGENDDLKPSLII